MTSAGLFDRLPPGWRSSLNALVPTEVLQSLAAFVQEERRQHTVFPPEECCFAAFEPLQPDAVKAVILGQDPYHDDFQAHGLAFSVPDGVKIPPSLRNIYKELADDLGCPAPQSGSLTGWASQGVLLLNTVLTVRAHQANSHQKHGWETVTDAAIRLVSAESPGAVFLLWGTPAQKKRPLIDENKHLVLAAAHPSPLSAYRGFFGSRPFSQANAWLAAHRGGGIDWQRTTTGGR